MSDKEFSAASERNRAPILQALRGLFADCKSVLEIGSGTGQHAVHFGAALPALQWQTSDLPGNHASIRAWIAESGLPNVLPPLALDVASSAWPAGPFDAIYSANTCHIMSWGEVQSMFAGIGRVLAPGGVLCIYGPFNRDGNYTSAGNAAFDASLKARAPHMGLRDVQALDALAREQGLTLVEDIAMPANNALLAWRRAG
jgi:cyclopropane fatty-acyl-phospholipid synthase-like methyltransferase